MTPQELNINCICGRVNCAIPYGICHCGCGQSTKIAKCNANRDGHVKGKPLKYVWRHAKRPPVTEEAVPFKIDGVCCRLIPLTQGQHAIVDESDYLWLMCSKWYAHWNEEMQSYYAARQETVGRDKQRQIEMHRQILGLDYGDPTETDHANHVTLDNRRKNIRPATSIENQQNGRRRSNNTSGYKNVCFHKRDKKWYSYVKIDGRRKYLGYFDTSEEAYRAFCKATIELHGEFACIA